MITGARQGKLSGIRRLLSAALARDLTVFIIPGPEYALAHNLDIEAAGMQPVASPRHASTLLLLGPLPPALCEAAAVCYAQMPRPRAIFVLGAADPAPLPDADVVTDLTQQGLEEGVQQLRHLFANESFRVNVADFDAPVLQVRIEYTCPMHPEIVMDEPGKCPICGMFLVERETQATTLHSHDSSHQTHSSADMDTPTIHHHTGQHDTSHDHETAIEQYTCPMHPDIVRDEPGSCPECGMDLVPVESSAESSTKSAAESGHEHHAHGDEHAAEHTAQTYTCPMHPEIISDKPGSCPECGMDLVPVESSAESMATSGHEHHAHGHGHAAEHTAQTYTCPMHPEIVRDEPGSCPRCGMDLVPVESSTESATESMATSGHEHHGHEHAGMDHNDHADMDHSSHTGTGHSGHGGMADSDHSGMDHGDMGFMSMVEVTRDLPRSRDELQMEWVDAPFGPFFPGLPGGLLLSLTLDGDAIARSETRTLLEKVELLQDASMECGSFVERLGLLDPLTPVSYRLLACRALENAAGIEIPADTNRARIGALERERITSHLGWLVLFARQTGFDWLRRRASSLYLKIRGAELQQIAALRPAIESLIKRLRHTPLLKPCTAGIGRLLADAVICGPVARAAGVNHDARNSDTTCIGLGFTAASRTEGDTLARLRVRLDEITHSLALIEAAGAIALPVPGATGNVSADGEAVVEAPRGSARLQLTLEQGQVTSAQLDTPSTHHLSLIAPMINQQEIGDALVAVGSLDLSPWEVRL